MNKKLARMPVITNKLRQESKKVLCKHISFREAITSLFRIQMGILPK